jgi:flagella basal body P-ring formation protein FlgA
MVPNFRRLVLLAASVAAPVSAQSTQRVLGFENLPMLDSRISAALGAGIGEPGGPVSAVDRRLHLAACPQPVEIAEPAMGAVTVRCQTLGWRIRIPLVGNGRSASAATPAAAARAAPTIRRGDQVQLVAISNGFTVSTLAVADQDGGPGDRIRVRTEHRAAPIIGQILDDGRVALPGFN